MQSWQTDIILFIVLFFTLNNYYFFIEEHAVLETSGITKWRDCTHLEDTRRQTGWHGLDIYHYWDKASWHTHQCQSHSAIPQSLWLKTHTYTITRWIWGHGAKIVSSCTSLQCVYECVCVCVCVCLCKYLAYRCRCNLLSGPSRWHHFGRGWSHIHWCPAHSVDQCTPERSYRRTSPLCSYKNHRAHTGLALMCRKRGYWQNMKCIKHCNVCVQRKMTINTETHR